MKYALFFILSFFSMLSYGQSGRGFRSEGKEFLLGYIHPTFIDSVRFSNILKLNVFAIVSSYKETKIELAYFDASGNEIATTPYNISAVDPKQILLSPANMKHKDPTGETAEFVSCLIRAKDPVTVEYVSDGPVSCASYLALPLSSWGKKYVVSSYNDNPGFGAYTHSFVTAIPLSSGAFMIIAGYNGTSVTITPMSTTLGGHIGATQGIGANGTPKPYTIELNKGQCYLVKSASALSSGTDDISGSVIVANKPIAVISGHQGANVGDGGVNDVTNYTQDLMIEQLISSEFWDNTGIYGIPQLQVTGNPSQGVGENYRIYVSGDSTPKIITASTSSSSTNYSPIPYGQPPELHNLTVPISFSSTEMGSKFSVMQYELRSQVINASYTAPNMCTIVPSSQWKNSYTWGGYVLGGDNFPFQNRYVTIVSEHNLDEIFISKDGSTPASLQNALSALKTWSGYPKAKMYRVAPSSHYYAYSKNPFMVYHFGGKEWDGSGDYGGEIETDDFFGCEAHPGGMSLFNKSIGNHLTVNVDTLCSGWRICVEDSNQFGGIRYISLLDDPKGNLFVGTNYQYKNCSFPALLDPNALNEFSLPGSQQYYCFTVNVGNPSQEAYAPLMIYDNAGNYKIIELRMKPRNITYTPDPFVQSDLFGKTRVGDTSCVRFAVRNGASNTEPMVITSAKTLTPTFMIRSLSHPLPASIVPGDSLVIDICFSSNDEKTHRDDITLGSECSPLVIPLQAKSSFPIITATDASMGKVSEGITFCKDVLVKNEGELPFMVTGVALTQTGMFSIDSSSLPGFPWALQANESKKLRLCYKSETNTLDTARITWLTDITAPFSSMNKDYSIITAQGESTTGVNDDTHNRSLEVKIYPQPAHDYMTLEVNLGEVSPVDVTIYDVLGNTITHRRVTDTKSGINTLPFSTKHFANGTYVVVIRTGNETTTKRVTVRR
ncbi:MAG TPA: T9SS type A sorting domain-containing protein [Candidatus Kapabacteria bacterium]